ncbi:hypothetical protein FZC66_06050 [Priestia megaterium]|nr:hypothetical protein FZC66_06050 [Priestia megaterium]
MSERRNIYDEHFINTLSALIEKEYTLFNKNQFQQSVFQNDWQDLALKQRMRRITESLYEALPKEYPKALSILFIVAPQVKGGLNGIIFPDYVEQYGLSYWNESMQALEFFTQYSTSEFAVRPFLLKDQEKMMAQFLAWSEHPNEHVRRLASEGCRPRLPWGTSIPSLKIDPRPVLPILTNLLLDESLYVRKSVANNLNDISKTHPDIVLELARKQYGNNAYTDWILKHACRTLLKQGNQQALSLFGFQKDDSLGIQSFTLQPDQIAIGDTIEFAFELHAKKNTKARIEYAVDYVKARGNRTRKVFKITETQLKENETKLYTRRLSFQDLSTRKHYKGTHTLSIILNGDVKTSLDFEIE